MGNTKLIQKLSHHDESQRRAQKEEHAMALKKIEEKLKVLSMEIQQNPANIKANLLSSTSSSLVTTTNTIPTGVVAATTTTTTAATINPTPLPQVPLMDPNNMKSGKEEISSKITCITGMVKSLQQNEQKTNNHSPALATSVISNRMSNALPPLASIANNNKKKFFLLHKQNQNQRQSQHLNLKKISNTKVGGGNIKTEMKKSFLPKLLAKPNNNGQSSNVKNYVNRSTSISDNDNKMMKLWKSKSFFNLRCL